MMNILDIHLVLVVIRGIVWLLITIDSYENKEWFLGLRNAYVFFFWRGEILEADTEKRTHF